LKTRTKARESPNSVCIQYFTNYKIELIMEFNTFLTIDVSTRI
jgi:hypothetical protein